MTRQREVTISRRIFKAFRAEMKMSQEKLGELMGLNQSAIARIEKGQQEASGDEILKLLYLTIPLTWKALFESLAAFGAELEIKESEELAKDERQRTK